MAKWIPISKCPISAVPMAVIYAALGQVLMFLQPNANTVENQLDFHCMSRNNLYTQHHLKGQFSRFYRKHLNKLLSPGFAQRICVTFTIVLQMILCGMTIVCQKFAANQFASVLNTLWVTHEQTKNKTPTRLRLPSVPRDSKWSMKGPFTH